jgi:hypothetical protein
MRLSDLPDPTNRAGARALLSPRLGSRSWEHAMRGVAAAVGTGPYKDGPLYAEASWGGVSGSTGRWTSSLHIGLHLRMSRTRDEATGAQSVTWGIGPALKLGVRLRPWSDSSFMLTATGRLTAYFPQHVGPSVIAGIARHVGRYQIDVGILVDHITTRTQTVIAFDDARTIENENWRPILMLSIARLAYDDPR